MNDQIIIEKILKSANIHTTKRHVFTKIYNENHLEFLKLVIKENKKYQQMFEDVYLKNMTLSKVSRKYLISYKEVLKNLHQVLDIELYLSLTKCRIDFKDPLYERTEFNQLCLETFGMCYEPLRLYLVKIYNLIEKKRQGIIYIIQENDFVIQKKENYEYETRVFDFELEFAKIISQNDEIVINDVLKMQNYIELASSVLKPRHYEKFYEYVKNNYYKSGFDFYISKSKAMLTREWSLAKLKDKASFERDEINFVLYDDIRRKDA